MRRTNLSSFLVAPQDPLGAENKEKTIFVIFWGSPGPLGGRNGEDKLVLIFNYKFKKQLSICDFLLQGPSVHVNFRRPVGV